ncbi:hypothetical protein [Pseudobacteriovorax antillogorgiicola]|uniref:Uncharacterized protein n=1 Tax=Pseudobacteriovorax antillogorgiicola TaxID=1513793 RepID=A0A1Y6BRS1_9BACT|nr:hypothetical protein [Pseudobacteriovorax antillogorgiicola]TCS55307.1 hypothetical protein EDD56_10528 [Pseudobacteriovorax antillogorgiicola]SMF14407.1 hypothetical protein SAMN06296036_105296 [Pseudobacteriovorax antillogorgiicola]
MARLILLIWTLCASQAQSLEMSAGQTKTMVFSGGGLLKVSRKGVIEIEPLKNNVYRIYALKKGIVTISHTIHDELQSKTLIMVQSRAASKPQVFQSPWDHFLCEHPGIQCDKKRQIIAGETSSWSWFEQARERCRKKMPCLFNVRLNSKGKENLIQAVGVTSHAGLEASSDGYLTATQGCDELKKLLGAQKTVRFRCLESTENLMIRSYIYWLKRDDVDQLGFDPWGVMGQNLLKTNHHRLQAYIESQKRSLSGEPEIRVTLGSVASARHGFDVVIPGKEVETKVLKGGVEVIVQPIRAKEGRVLLDIESVLRLPSGSDSRFEASRMQTKVWATFGQRLRVGTLTIDNDHWMQGRNSLFDGVPILSPLFRDTSSGQGQATLFMELQVERSGSLGRG